MGVLRRTSTVLTRAAELEVPAGMTIDEMLAAARARLRRLEPAQAAEAAAQGALLIDTRPAAQRAEYGEIPGALLIERNHLEWRLDPTSDARIPEATSHDVSIVVVCQAGYSSSLAAASLQDIGLLRATDLAGGFDAWADAGLPVTRRDAEQARSPAAVSWPPSQMVTRHPLARWPAGSP